VTELPLRRGSVAADHPQMTSPRPAAIRSLLVGAALPLAVAASIVAVSVVPASAAPSPATPDSLRGATSAVADSPGAAVHDIASARGEAARLRAEVDSLAARARQAVDAADRDERRYFAAAARAVGAQREYDVARRTAAALAEVGNDRVRALYMSGGQFGAMNTLLKARGVGDLSSRQVNVSTLVDEDTLRTREAEAAARVAAAAKAKVDAIVAEQAEAATAASTAVNSAAIALRSRRDLLERADGTVQALVAAQAVEQAAARRAVSERALALQAVDPGTVPVSGSWGRPAIGPISSGFGQRWGRLHAGIDFAARPGSVIRAASNGTVTLARWFGGYGNAVDVDHGGGVMTRYGHASELLVVPGEYVTVGQPIALVGSTGDSTGPHLHFEVRIRNTPIDPIPFLLARGVDVR
jgi:murein DD-endopeptidase MepM/ murein hydrolase activator NlpD